VNIPEGYKLVPVVPTEEMLSVLHERVLISVNTRKQEANILNDKAWWAAVIAAAPAQPQPAAHLTIPGALEWDQLPGPVEIEYPEFSEQGMGCGLEDRGITDRYEAMRYGYDEALDQFARILDGYGPLYTHADTHGVVGTHGADGESRVHGDAEKVETTPSAKWRENGEQDPHGERYSCERAALALGRMTDDELANAVFMHDHRGLDIEAILSGEPSSIGLLTAAKDRIRWLSRSLEEAIAQLANTEQSRRSFFDLSQDLEKRLAEHKALLLECQPALEKAGYSTWQIDELLAASAEPATDHSVDASEKAKPKTCTACDGWGTISTGIDEAPSTSCKKCDGTGKGGEQ
jgi:hypothetical protein